MVAMEIDVLVGFNANSSSSKRREGTNLDTLSDFIKKKNLILKVATWQFKEVLKVNKEGKHLNGSEKKMRKGKRTIERKGLRMKRRRRLRENLK